jgi:hypothetical protein
VKAQAVSRRPVTAEAQVRSQVQGMLDLWWTKWHCGRFLTKHFGFHLSVPYHQCSMHIIIICILTLLLSEGQAGETWEPQNATLCRISERNGQNILHTGLQGLIRFFTILFTFYLYTTSLTSHHGVPPPPCSTVFAIFMSSYYIPVQQPGYSKRPFGQLNVSPLAFNNATSRFKIPLYCTSVSICTTCFKVWGNYVLFR